MAAASTPTGPAFDVVLLAHVACTLIALLTIVVSWVQARRLVVAVGPPDGGPAGRGPVEGGRARRAPSSRAGRAPDGPEILATAVSLRRYYGAGTNWIGRTLHAVPVLGFVLLALSHGAYGLDDGWVLGGLALWAVAGGGAEGVLWPTETRIGAALGRLPGGLSGRGVPGPGRAGGVDPGGAIDSSEVGVALGALVADGRRVQLVAAAIGAALVVAIVMMVAKP
ncbi:MAG TPA: hypothetical protein VGL60_05515 [Acidimicrobiales bacterium]